MRRLSLFLLTILGVLALAACAQSLPTAEEIVSRMEAARAATTSAEATVTLNFSTQERNGSLTVLGWMEQTGTTNAAGQPVARVRAEVAAASEPDLAGTTLVSDGTSFWLYNPAENTVITGVMSELKGAAQTTPAGAATMLTDVIGQGLDAVDLTVLGVEEVAGKSTWKVGVTPRAETSAQLRLDGVINGTMWVDEELALPLKLELDASDFGQGTLEVSNLIVNEPINPARFSFDIPAGATVVQAADLAAQMQQQSATNVEEARTAVSFAMREPGYLPAGVSLVEVRVVGTSTVILNYVGEGTSLSVVQSNEDVGRDREPPAGSQVEEVTVNGVPATLITGADGQGSLLRWEESGVRYVVAGTLSGAEALLVAEGLK
jgi:outer membrane lipoprotein-sorting protein